MAIPILILLSSCDETFVPWQENDQYFFSIYGYLDASADTQWVRVMPVREDLFYEPEPIDAVVTLEHVESGETSVLNDSLFSFFQGYVWNYWTTMKLYPEHTYRINAVRNNQTSHAIVELPPDFPVPVLQTSRGPGGISSRDVVQVKEVNQLADIRILYFIQIDYTDEVFMYSFPHLKDTTRLEGGGYSVILNQLENTRTLNNIFGSTTITVLDRQIFIAAGGPGFHNFPFIDEKVAALPGGISNVENGTGYLAGIVSKTIPYESCYDGGGVLIPCEPLPSPW